MLYLIESAHKFSDRLQSFVAERHLLVDFFEETEETEEFEI